MSWIVILDNGQDYSDHHHWTVLTCASAAEANEAVAAFNDWRDRVCAEKARRDDAGESEFLDAKAWAPPFWPSDECLAWDGYGPYSLHDWSVAAIEVPAWAEVRK